MSYDEQEMNREHQLFWDRFLKLTAVTTGGIILILVLMALFLL